MAITFDGANKIITLDTATSFNVSADIYIAHENWAVLSANMQYLEGLESVGKESLGGGVFTDLITVLKNGWKLRPSGYAADTQITLIGTFIVDGGGNYAVAPVVGSPVQWYVQATTAATVVATGGSALTTDEHNKLYGIDTKIGTPTTGDLATDLLAL